jgi:hypothetical protein
MIKALCHAPDGRKLLVFGLSHENIRRMKKGQPLRVDLDLMGLEGVSLAIYVGKTEADIEAAMEPFIDSNTVIHDLRKPN